MLKNNLMNACHSNYINIFDPKLVGGLQVYGDRGTAVIPALNTCMCLPVHQNPIIRQIYSS